jgi:hypothetical protein
MSDLNIASLRTDACGFLRFVGSLFAVFADGFDGATLHGLAAEIRLLVVFGLFENERMTVVIVAFEVCGSGLAAEIAIDALVVHVEPALHVLFVSV